MPMSSTRLFSGTRVVCNFNHRGEPPSRIQLLKSGAVTNRAVDGKMLGIVDSEAGATQTAELLTAGGTRYLHA
jgi:hypothetical protein